MFVMQHLAIQDPYPAAPTEVVGFTFTEDLFLRRLKDKPTTRSGLGANFVVERDYTVCWDSPTATGQKITVPRGMITDLASVPPVFRWLIGRVGPYLEAAVVHDFLTIAWRSLDGNGSVERRKFADDIMLAAMKAACVGWQRPFIYGAIRAHAWATYPKSSAPGEDHALYIDLDASDSATRTV